ncbi:MAG: nucleotide exchange factor GrpE [Actinomycetota bacterium]
MADDAAPTTPDGDEAASLESARLDTALLRLDLPDDREEAVGVLLDALATARGAADAYLEDLQRVAAEFENYRKRAARERDETVARAAQRVVQALLPVLDSFDQAFAHEAQTTGEEQVLAGVRGTFHQLMDVLSKEGLEAIPTVGEDFDPQVHEAVAGGGEGDLMVSQELRSGYALKGRVLRPAMVVVAPRPQAGSAGESEG